MTNEEKLQKIAKILASEIKAQPLPRTLEEDLIALAADWIENPTHRMYGEILMDRLSGK